VRPAGALTSTLIEQCNGKELVLFVRDKFVGALRDKQQIDAFLHDPEAKEITDSVIGWLANGWSPQRIANITGLHVELVRQIREEHPEAISNIKASIATQLGEVVQILAERMLATAHEIDPAKIPQSLALVLDKYQLLSGGATARFEHKNVASAEDLQKMFDALPAAKVVEITDSPNGNGMPKD